MYVSCGKRVERIVFSLCLGDYCYYYFNLLLFRWPCSFHCLHLTKCKVSVCTRKRQNSVHTNIGGALQNGETAPTFRDLDEQKHRRDRERDRVKKQSALTKTKQTKP